jgi:hypothetical protein
MLKELLWDAFSLQGFDVLTESKSIWLSEEVRHQLLVVSHWLPIHSDWSLRLGVANELSRDDSSLMHKLVETVLTISSWLSKNDWTAINSFIKWDSFSSHNLTIALHIALLDVSWES